MRIAEREGRGGERTTTTTTRRQRRKREESTSLLKKVQALVEGEREVMGRKLREKELEIALLRRKIEDVRTEGSPAPDIVAEQKLERDSDSIYPSYLRVDLSRLRRLDLSDQRIFPGEIELIARKASACLESVNLSRNDLDSRHVDSITLLCSNPLRVCSLNLSQNNFGKSALRAFDAALRGGTRARAPSSRRHTRKGPGRALRWIDMSSNPFAKQEDSVAVFTAVLAHFPNLQGYGVTFAPPDIVLGKGGSRRSTPHARAAQKMTKRRVGAILDAYKHLWHQQQQQRGSISSSGRRGATGRSSALVRSCRMRALSLTGTMLPSRAVRALGRHLVKNAVLRSLTHLDMSFAYAGHEAAATISAMLRTHRSIMSLSLRHNDIRDAGALAIARAVLRPTRNGARLTSLDISNNCISSHAIARIGRALRADGTIVRLRLGGRRHGYAVDSTSDDADDKQQHWIDLAEGIERSGTIFDSDIGEWDVLPASFTRTSASVVATRKIARRALQQNCDRAWIWTSDAEKGATPTRTSPNLVMAPEGLTTTTISPPPPSPLSSYRCVRVLDISAFVMSRTIRIEWEARLVTPTGRHRARKLNGDDTRPLFRWRLVRNDTRADDTKSGRTNAETSRHTRKEGHRVILAEGVDTAAFVGARRHRAISSEIGARFARYCVVCCCPDNVRDTRVELWIQPCFSRQSSSKPRVVVGDEATRRRAQYSVDVGYVAAWCGEGVDRVGRLVTGHLGNRSFGSFVSSWNLSPTPTTSSIISETSQVSWRRHRTILLPRFPRQASATPFENDMLIVVWQFFSNVPSSLLESTQSWLQWRIVKGSTPSVDDREASRQLRSWMLEAPVVAHGTFGGAGVENTKINNDGGSKNAISASSSSSQSQDAGACTLRVRVENCRVGDELSLVLKPCPVVVDFFRHADSDAHARTFFVSTVGLAVLRDDVRKATTSAAESTSGHSATSLESSMFPSVVWSDDSAVEFAENPFETAWRVTGDGGW